MTFLPFFFSFPLFLLFFCLHVYSGTAYDNVGHNFGKDGRLENWWTAKANAQFQERAECIAAQYSKFEPLPGVFIDGCGIFILAIPGFGIFGAPNCSAL